MRFWVNLAEDRSSCWIWPNRWCRYKTNTHIHTQDPLTWWDTFDIHILPVGERFKQTRTEFSGSLMPSSDFLSTLFLFLFSFLSSLHLPSIASSIQPELVVWMRGADHPGEKWGGSHYPQKCRGPTKGPWDIRVRERGRQRGGEIGEDMKECISEGEGRDWLGWRDEGTDKERQRWEREKRWNGVKHCFLFIISTYAL